MYHVFTYPNDSQLENCSAVLQPDIDADILAFKVQNIPISHKGPVSFNSHSHFPLCLPFSFIPINY